MSVTWSWVFLGGVLVLAIVLGLALANMASRGEDRMSDRWLMRQRFLEDQADAERREKQ